MSLQAVGYFYMGDWPVFIAAFPVSYNVKAKEVDLYRKAAATLGYTKNQQGQVLHFSVVEVEDPQSLIGEANEVFLRLKNQYFPIHVMFNFDDYKQELEQLNRRYPTTMDDAASKRFVDEQIGIIAKLCVEVLPPVYSDDYELKRHYATLGQLRFLSAFHSKVVCNGSVKAKRARSRHACRCQHEGAGFSQSKKQALALWLCAVLSGAV
jgi:hypothetical protein